MASAAELRKAIGATAAELAKWEKAGVPSSGSGRKKTYDVAAVREWLVAQGLREAPKKIVPRLKDVALALGKSERTIQNWKDRGMPFGSDGYDLVAIAAWRRDEFGDDEESDEDEDTRGYWETRRAKAAALRDELKLAQDRGEVIHVDVPAREFGAFLVEARAMIGQLPDWLLAQLPKKFPASERKTLLAKAQKHVAGVLASLQKALEKKAAAAREAAQEGEA